MRFLLLIFITLIAYQLGFTQKISNHRVQLFFVTNDTLIIDQQAIVPFSEIVYQNNILLDAKLYEIDYTSSLFIIKDKSLLGKQLKIIYKVLPISFSETFEHKKQFRDLAFH